MKNEVSVDLWKHYVRLGYVKKSEWLGHPLWTKWYAMIRRCLWSKDPNFHNYGGRGITVCDRWLYGEDGLHPFDCFVIDMETDRNCDDSLDRIDNDKGYSSDNCRWASAVEQANNKREPQKQKKKQSRKTKPEGPAQPFTPEQISTLNTLLSAGPTRKEIRDFALFRVMLDTMLRVSDVVQLTVGDIKDNDGNIKSKIVVRQKKTNKQVHCIITAKTKDALRIVLNTSGSKGSGARLFPITTRQVQNRVKIWARMLRIDAEHISPHSLRRTRPTEVYKKTGNLRAAQVMLGHSSIVTTAGYLGIDRAEAIDVFSQVEM